MDNFPDTGSFIDEIVDFFAQFHEVEQVFLLVSQGRPLDECPENPLAGVVDRLREGTDIDGVEIVELVLLSSHVHADDVNLEIICEDELLGSDPDLVGIGIDGRVGVNKHIRSEEGVPKLEILESLHGENCKINFL